jgi:signal transduction histidine kinase
MAALLPREKDSDLMWRDMSYDIAWEATSGGVIRCRSVLNQRTDIFDAVEGLNLRAIRCDRLGRDAWELLSSARRLRHIEVRLPGKFGPEHLYLTAALKPDGAIAGTFCALDRRLDELVHRDLALLNQTRDARAREEDYRREADIMLRGLRALLGQSTAGERLETLSGLAVEAVSGAEHCLLHVGRDGSLRAPISGKTVPDDGSLARLFLSQVAPVARHRRDQPQTEALCALLGAKDREIVVTFLPVASENVALVCAARLGEEFSPGDIGLANRFALILKQALILKDEQDRLVQSGKLSALGQMSASLAHELRQPLNTISAAAQNLEMMTENGPVEPQVLAQKVARILGQVERASLIMDRIRRFSRKSGGVFELTDLSALAEGVRLLMEPVAMAARVKLEVKIEEGLQIRCDAIQIEQVLTNLMRNALDALAGIGSARRTENGVIALHGGRTEGGVVLRVQDNGPGFPADITSRPLETFFTTKDAGAGTGLGLSICHMIAREHAGRLELGNYAGGAYAELYLPERSDGES